MPKKNEIVTIEVPEALLDRLYHLAQKHHLDWDALIEKVATDTCNTLVDAIEKECIFLES